MKSVCIIASDNVVIDGDVVFIDQEKFGSEIVVYLPLGIENFKIIQRGLHVFAYGLPPKKGLKLKLLWFWHMVVLRKSHVYLTGALR
ncbi:hypothetical protein [Acinetobacter sp. Ver3]|uniref:hypothetical protein n=1 Tax=Acinetobacter sp. Ver3 TaxID=466088 RepID=UPI0004485CF9|nr:hypothetical protein [Acinetobacter sp. Ver3]EZQ12166.1 hypothetical protein CL42_02035 [Acinetobacter sp. Ver3]